jgi:spermidine synthase
VKQEFHQFSPHGVSGVVIITESHLTIHTWPEHRYAAVDFFTCGAATDPIRAHEFLTKELGATSARYVTLRRGIEPPREHTGEGGSLWRARRVAAGEAHAVRAAPLDEAAYHETLVVPAFVLTRQPLRRVAILGGGEGAALREVLRFPEVERCVMVDIDEEVVALCRRHLAGWSAGAFEDRRAEVCFEDAHRFLERAVAAGERYDLILSDLPEAETEGPLGQLHARPFFDLVRRCLTPGGAYAGQVGGLRVPATVVGPGEILASAAASFGGVHAYSRYIPSYGAEWVFAITGASFGDEMLRPPQLAPPDIDRILEQRRDPRWPCRTYDGLTHQRLFSLPRDVRAALAQPGAGAR